MTEDSHVTSCYHYTAHNYSSKTVDYLTYETQEH